MPMSRQKQGVGGNSSIAYKRWEPLDENDLEDNDADYENRNLDTGQVKIMLQLFPLVEKSFKPYHFMIDLCKHYFSAFQ